MSLIRTMKLAVGAALLSLSFALPTNAATLTFYDDGLTPSGERFTLTCSGSCTAWDGVDFAGTDGDLFDLPNSGEQTEIDKVNSVTGGGFTSLTKDSSGNNSFMSSAAYILIKIGRGPNVGIVQNLTGGNTFTFTEVAGTGSGLSHISEFGKTTVVPLPAAGFLLLSAVGLLGFTRRRKA